MTLNDTQQHLRHLLLDNVSDNVLKEEISNVEQTSKETGVRVDGLLNISRSKKNHKIKIATSAKIVTTLDIAVICGTALLA